MSELQLKSKCVPGTIDLNSEDLKKNIAAMVSAYTDYVVTEDGIAQAKKDKATLKKIQKAMSDKRIEIKGIYTAPLTEFENKVKELSALIDEPVNLIDKQLKLFEEERVEKKKARIAEIYAEMMGDLAEYCTLEQAFKNEWTNASFNDQAVRFDISAVKMQTENDIEAIKALKSENEKAVLDDYKIAGLAHAVHLNNVLNEASQKAAEAARIKAEEEAARKIEQKAEAAKKTEIEKHEPTKVTETGYVSIKIGMEFWEKAKAVLEDNWIPFEEA